MTKLVTMYRKANTSSLPNKIEHSVQKSLGMKRKKEKNYPEREEKLSIYKSQK